MIDGVHGVSWCTRCTKCLVHKVLKVLTQLKVHRSLAAGHRAHQTLCAPGVVSVNWWKSGSSASAGLDVYAAAVTLCMSL